MRRSTSLMAAAAAALLLVVLLAAVNMSYGERSEEETRRMFVEWVATFGKTYDSIGEEERRYALFKDNLRMIDQHNAGFHSYTLGLNQFSDLTREEVRRNCFGALRPEPKIESGGSTIPGEMDQRWT